ncbi:MAG: hypothetical protein Q8S26_17880 [Azonexus sp.]|nr:hypothetical protein [Azonexus sp.]
MVSTDHGQLVIRIAKARPVKGTVACLPLLSPEEQRVKTPGPPTVGERPPYGRKVIAVLEANPLRFMVTLPSKAGVYLRISVGASSELLPLMSLQTIHPDAQLLPDVLHVVDEAAIQRLTDLLRVPASLRANDKSPTRSLICPVSRVLVMSLWKEGSPIINKTARMLITIINSISVMPLLVVRVRSIVFEFI